MATTPEGLVVKKIVKYLKHLKPELYYMKPVQMMGSNMILDFHGVYKGNPFAIEAKAPGKKPTARQENTIKWLETSGCKCFVIDGDSSLEEFSLWVQSH